MNFGSNTNRGNWWQMHYEPGYNISEVRKESLGDLTNRPAFSNCIIVPSNEENYIEKNLYLKNIFFSKCDFKTTLMRCSFRNCTFIKCDFSGSTWKEIKFRKCKFINCDFSHTTFKRCLFFEDCNFEKNSTSAEHFLIEKTSIHATSFINSIETNLSYLPNDVSGFTTLEEKKAYQRNRLEITKGKIAKTIFSSNSSQSEIDFIYI